MASSKASMTERERVEALLRREKPDRVPNWPLAPMGFSMIYTGKTIAEGYNSPKLSYEAQKKTHADFNWVFVPTLCHGAFGASEYGGEIRMPDGEFAQSPTVVRNPVEKPEDVFDLKVPEDIKTAGWMPVLVEFMEYAAAEQLDNEPFNVVALCGMGPYSTHANLVGVGEFSKWMIKRPDAVEHILKLGAEFHIALAKAWKEMFGTEGVLPYIGEPSASNQVISPVQFEKFVLPCVKTVNEACIEMGYKHLYAHICGEHNANLPHWAKIPWGDPGFIGLPHEIDLVDGAKYFPDDIIVGNLEPRIVQTETPDNVYEATREVVEKGKSLKQGYVFSQGCELPPMTPLENITAMNQAVEDFGYY
jgi:uroporphyrinogen decarboxylase